MVAKVKRVEPRNPTTTSTNSGHELGFDFYRCQVQHILTHESRSKLTHLPALLISGRIFPTERSASVPCFRSGAGERLECLTELTDLDCCPQFTRLGPEESRRDTARDRPRP